jgi:hypothetical protein
MEPDVVIAVPAPSRGRSRTFGAAVLTAGVCLASVAVVAALSDHEGAPTTPSAQGSATSPVASPAVTSPIAPKPDPEQAQLAAETLSALYKLKGFAEVRLVESKTAVLVLWNGEIPDEVKEVQAEYSDVPINLQASMYSADQLVGQAKELLASHPDSGIVSIEPTEEFNGLRILTRKPLSAQQERELELAAYIPLQFALAGAADGIDAAS